MTRIFGYQSEKSNLDHIPFGVKSVLNNLQQAIGKTYTKNWQAYGIGFIIVDKNGSRNFSVYKGYQGIKAQDNITELMPTELHHALANNPKCVIGVLQNGPDNGEEAFNNEDKGRKFPLESDNWFVITMGSWGNNGYSDENLPWYNKSRPSLSTAQYLETNPEKIDFTWIDPKRTPFIIAVKKDGTEILVVDDYSKQNEKGYSYVIAEAEGLVLYQGVRDEDGNQI